MKKYMQVISLILIIALNTVSLYPSIAYAPNTNAAEILIIYRDERDLNVLTSHGCEIEREFRLFRTVLALCPISSIATLRDLGLDVKPNFNISLSSTVKSFKVVRLGYQQSSYSYEAPYYWSWAVSRVSADISWTYLGESGFNSVIAILDTGIDPTHPILADKLVGWIEFDSKGRAVCSRPHDTHGHGTWVSSIAVGGDGSTYIFGVAPNAKIMVALVLPYGYGTAAQVLAGLEWVLDPYDACTGAKLGLKPNVVSMSFGAPGNYSNVFLPAVEKLIESGIVPVAAIGNMGPYSSSNPGNIWGVIGVGATDVDNNVAWFSSYEEVEWPEPPSEWPFKGYYPKRYTKPDIVAPGVDIPGAYPGGLFVIGSGTSAATPIVAGVAAILSSKLRLQGLDGPALVERVYDILTSTAMLINNPGAGAGLVDMYKAVAKAKGMQIVTAPVYVYPEEARPLDKVAIEIPIALLRNIDIYISGVKVFSGAVTSRFITVEIPLTHMGRNTLTIVGYSGELYGKTFLSVVPRLIADSECLWGEQCNVILSGVGIADTVGIYLGGIGDNLLTIGFADLRGTYISLLVTPVAKEGIYNLTVVDFTNPSIYLVTTIAIKRSWDVVSQINITNVNVTNITNIVNMFSVTSISVNSKPYYVIGSTDFVDICVHNGTVKRVQIANVLDRDSRVNAVILNVTPVDVGVYRVWFRTAGYVDGDAYIIMNATVSTNSMDFPYVFIVRVRTSDPIEAITRGIEKLSNAYNSTYTYLENELKSLKSEVTDSLTSLSNAVNILNRTVSNLREESRANINLVRAEMATVLDYVRFMAITALALSALAVGLVIYIGIRGKR